MSFENYQRLVCCRRIDSRFIQIDKILSRNKSQEKAKIESIVSFQWRKMLFLAEI